MIGHKIIYGHSWFIKHLLVFHSYNKNNNNKNNNNNNEHNSFLMGKRVVVVLVNAMGKQGKEGKKEKKKGEEMLKRIVYRGSPRTPEGGREMPRSASARLGNDA